MHADKTVETDVLIIGAEGAGMRAAIEARERGVEVLSVTKLYQARSGSTICAPGDYVADAAALRDMGLHDFVGDTVEEFYEDVMASGQRINDPVLARLMVEQAPQRLRDLLDYGAKFDRVYHYGGHRSPRSASMGRVGKTGVGVMQTLGRKAGSVGAKLMQGCTIIDLVVDDGVVQGAIGVDLDTGDYVAITAKAVILATGGAARAFEPTSNPEESTGDGMAMAYRAGAQLMDMEMMQFIPYAQATPQAMRGNIHFAYELVSLLPSYLVNSLGERFMQKYDPVRMEKSTRDFLSLGIATEVAEGRGSVNGGAYVAMDHIDPAVVRELADSMFPNWRVGAFSLQKFGYDPSIHAVEVTPASHYSCGGIRIDAQCRTTIDGLFAAGEVAAGVNGANRLSGAALTETQVFGAIAGASAADRVKQHKHPPKISGACIESAVAAVESICAGAGERSTAVRAELLSQSQQKLGVLRSCEGLESMIGEIQSLRAEARRVRLERSERSRNQELHRALEVRNMVDVLDATARSALSRRESRGGHRRLDHPETASQPTNTLIRNDGDGDHVETVEVRA